VSRVLRSRASESLLEALLDYAREVLDADIAVFSERIPGEPLRAFSVAGPLSDAAAAAVEAPPTEEPGLAAGRPMVIDPGEPGTPDTIRRHLTRLGAAWGLFVPVLETDRRSLYLELYHADRASMGDADPDQAAKLAAMLAAVVSRDALADENARFLTEVRHTATALRASEARLRRLIECLPAIVYETDAEGRTAFTSRPEASLFGYPREQWEADPDEMWRRCLHPDDRERVLEEWRRAVAEAVPHDGRYRMLTADGRAVWLSEYESLVRDAAGNVLLREGVAVDVTAQVEAEQARIDAELRYRTLIEQLPAAAYVQHMDWRTEFIGPRIEKILGYPRARWADEPGFWRECVHPADREAAVARHDSFVRGGQSYDDEYRMIRADGETRWIRETAAVLSGDDGVPYMVQGIVADVTDRKVAEGLLRERERQRLSVLAAMVAAEEEERHRIAGELHDDSIQVMTATLFALDRMLRAADAGDVTRAAAAARAARPTLAEATERTRRLSFELRPPTLEMHGVGRAVRVLADELGGGAGFEVTVQTRLRRYDETTETLVFRAVREALTNARKHAGASRVDVSVVERRGVIECEVADDGVGFDVEQVRTLDRVRLHFGLDALAERLRLAGGDLAIESGPGRGTRIRMSVPVVRRAA
jgi:PAS domain S-box-containing protein